MCIAGVTGSHTSDRERKGKRDVDWITIGSEAHLAASESLETTQQGVVARPPCPPDSLWSLTNIYVATPIPTVTVATVDAVAADKPIQAGSNGGHGIFRFAENPDLDHITGFPVIARGGEARGDGHPGGVFVENVAVQREPPTINSAKQ